VGWSSAGQPRPRRFRWAGHQLANLDLAVSDYIDADPYDTVYEDDPEAKEWREYARERFPPLTSIANIVEDLLNNLHGTLDYLARQLALRENRDPDTGTAFPLVKTMKPDGTEPVVNIFRGTGKKRVPLIADEYVLTALRYVQPYTYGDLADAHPLQVLRTLNGESKHRFPVVTSAAAVPPTIRAVGSNTVQFGSPWRRVQNGDEVSCCLYEWLPEGGPPNKTKRVTEVRLKEWPENPRTKAPLTVETAMRSIGTYINGYVLAPFGTVVRVVRGPDRRRSCDV
jgi:hypothetical protein